MADAENPAAWVAAGLLEEVEAGKLRSQEVNLDHRKTQDAIGLGDLLRAAADEHELGLGDLTVLSAVNDPFRLDTPTNHDDRQMAARSDGSGRPPGPRQPDP